MKPIIYPYKLGSKSAKKLAELLGTKRVRPDGNYRPRKHHFIVSLGAQQYPRWGARADELRVPVVNKWGTLDNAQNKLAAFYKLQEAGIPVPKFTNSREEAKAFFTQRRSVVFCRTLLRAHGGRGIVIARSPEELVPAPLYTKYFPKRFEYRIHVFKGEVIDAAQKRLVRAERREEERNQLVRNLENGWIYAREGLNIPQALKDACIKSCQVLNLDFGAVDCAVAEDGSFAIFEVNTAPGLEGTTLQSYASAIRRHMAKEEQKQNAYRPVRRVYR